MSNQIAEHKTCIIKNKVYDETNGEKGVFLTFKSISDAEKYIKDTLKDNPGRLSFTRLQAWKDWGEAVEEDFLQYGYKSGSRVALYTNTGYRAEVFKQGEEIKDTLPEILEIRNKNPKKPLDLSDLRKRVKSRKMEEKVQEMENNREEIISKYASIYLEQGKVTYRDLTDAGIKRSAIKVLYRDIDEIEQDARHEFPHKFKDIRLNSIYTTKYMKDLRDVIKDESIKRFLITTAVTGCEVDKNFLASAKHYCAVNNAKLLIMLSTDPASRVAKSASKIDKALADECIVFEEMSLNSKISLSSIKTSAKMVYPQRALSRVGKRTRSLIVASPKQDMDVTATGDNEFTHVQMTTGAITIPNYETDKYWSERTSYIAYHDHVMGGLIVEIEDNKLFHYRQIQADNKGRFVDLGVMYGPKSTVEFPPEALIEPDRHVGDTNPVVENIIYEIYKETKARSAFCHDIFNGTSVNHHERKNKLTRAELMNMGKLTLAEELKRVTETINKMTKIYDKLYIVKSNHDEFLSRYLESGFFIDEPQNLEIALELALAKIQGNEPFRYGVEKFGLEDPDKIEWLDRDQPKKIANIEVGAHGDLGCNGARGNAMHMEKAYGNAVSGHSHTPRILRGAWVVGTMTHLRVSYTRGPSGWMNTLCLVYPNGSRQMINIIKGKWRLK